MNSSSATSQSGASLLPEGIGALTTVHFAILALIAIGVVAMIVAGVRRSRIRHHAAREMKRHAEEAGVAAEPECTESLAPPPPASPAPVAAPEPAPVAPAPVDATPPETGPLADEPIAAAAPMEASPASEAAPESAAPAPAPAPVDAAPADQPVTLLKGLGPKVSAALADRGIATVGQLAALDDGEAAALDADLGPFRGRMGRDRWIEQARFLAAGDRAGFESVFGKL